jgi:thymidylate kinase
VQQALAQRLAPVGLHVALLGPDGAGKTTTAALIAQAPVRRIPFSAVRSRLGYRQTLPPLLKVKSAILRRRIAPTSTSLDPHGAPAHHPLVWVLKFAYYAADQWLEQVWMRREMAHGCLVLKDRHLLELPIDPMRYRYSGPPILARAMARLVPQPTLIIVLDAPTDVLRGRKQEVSEAETARQLRAYRALARRAPHACLVNSAQPLDDVVRDVEHAITGFTTQRMRRRGPAMGAGTHERRAPSPQRP